MLKIEMLNSMAPIKNTDKKFGQLDTRFTNTEYEQPKFHISNNAFLIAERAKLSCVPDLDLGLFLKSFGAAIIISQRSERSRAPDLYGIFKHRCRSI